MARKIHGPKLTESPIGYVAYRGPSMIDGSPIILVVNKIENSSANEKTGAMVQTWILRESDLAPQVHVKAGSDTAICGDCRHASGNGCYVQVHNAPRSVWDAFNRGRYATAPIHVLADVLAGKRVRCGSYGDPAAVPFEVWNGLLSRSKSNTGYTHQWRKCDQRFRSILMASCDAGFEVHHAENKGWRVFYVKSAGDPTALETGSMLESRKLVACPASKEAGRKSTCDRCGLCNGARSEDDRRASIVILPHGARASRVKNVVEVLATI